MRRDQDSRVMEGAEARLRGLPVECRASAMTTHALESAGNHGAGVTKESTKRRVAPSAKAMVTMLSVIDMIVPWP